MVEAIQKRCEDLDRAIARLAKLSSHDALVILSCSLSAPKLLCTLRTSPCAGHPLLDRFDMSLREGLSLSSPTPNSQVSIDFRRACPSEIVA